MAELTFCERTTFYTLCNALDKIHCADSLHVKADIMRQFISSFREQSRVSSFILNLEPIQIKKNLIYLCFFFSERQFLSYPQTNTSRTRSGERPVWYQGTQFGSGLYQNFVSQ